MLDRIRSGLRLSDELLDVGGGDRDPAPSLCEENQLIGARTSRRLVQRGEKDAGVT
jgi:hypothetical protein